MMKKVIYILFLCFLAGSCKGKNLVVKQGFIDLSNYDFEKGPVSLTGDWFFYCGDFIKLEEHQDIAARNSILVPSSWISQEDCNLVSKVTYYMTIKLPKNRNIVSFHFERILGSYQIFLNKIRILSTSLNKMPFNLTYRYNESQTTLNLVLYIDSADTMTVFPGIIGNIYVGDRSDLQILKYSNLFYDLFFSFGVFFFLLFLFYNGLIYYKFEKKTVLLFSIYSCLCFVYLFLANSSPFISGYLFFTEFLSEELYFKINSLFIILIPFFFFLFMYFLHISSFHQYKIFNYLSYTHIFLSSLLFIYMSILIVLPVDISYFQIPVLPANFSSLFSLVLIIWMNQKNLFDKSKYRYEILIASLLYSFLIVSFLVLYMTSQHFSILTNKFLVHSLPLSFSITFLGFAFFKYLIFYNREIVEQEIKTTEDAYNKLFPKKILELNQVANLINFKKNQQTEQQLIFAYIKLVPNLEFEEVFFNNSNANFVNSCYKKINAILLKSSGLNFSYTYENDLIVIFKDALESARISREITKIDFQNLKVFISLHVQTSQMKVIGIKEDCRVILQPSFIESLLDDLSLYAQTYGCQIVASESFIDKLPSQTSRSIEYKSNEFYHRSINLCSREYFEEIIYEIFEDSEESRQKLRSIKLHKQAFNLVVNGNLQQAVNIWESLLKISSDDQLIRSLVIEYNRTLSKEKRYKV